MATTPTKAKVEDEREPEKKAYVSPRLEVYGDIREIAKTVGHAGNFDGAPMVLKTQ